MSIQTLTGAEIDQVAGGVFTVSGPGLSASVDPTTLLTGAFGLAGAAIAGLAGLVGGLVGTVTGLAGLLGGLISLPSLRASASVSVSASASVQV